MHPHSDDPEPRGLPYRDAQPTSSASVAIAPIDPDLRPSARRFGIPAAPVSYWAAFTTALVGAPLLLYAFGGAAELFLPAAVLLPPLFAKAVDRLVLAKGAAREFNVAMVAAQEATSRGQLDDAETRFRMLLRRFRGRGGLEAIALHNIAALRAQRADIPGALRILHALHTYEGTRLAATVSRMVPLQISLFATQIGDVAEARRWLSIARTRAAGAKMYTSNVEALILTREGRYAEAEAVYLSEWPDLERVLAAQPMRAIRARRAFALEKQGADAETVHRMIESARPQNPRELAHAAVGWDEMRAFLERNGLI